MPYYSYITFYTPTYSTCKIACYCRCQSVSRYQRSQDSKHSGTSAVSGMPPRGPSASQFFAATKLANTRISSSALLRDSPAHVRACVRACARVCVRAYVRVFAPNMTPPMNASPAPVESTTYHGTHARTHARTHACTHACTHTRTHARTCRAVYVCTQMFVCGTYARVCTQACVHLADGPGWARVDHPLVSDCRCDGDRHAILHPPINRHHIRHRHAILQPPITPS